MTMKVGILASGEGTNFHAIAEHARLGILRGVEIAVLIYNHPEASVRRRADSYGVKCQLISQEGKGREEFDRDVMNSLEKFGVELVALAGWDRIFGMEFIKRYSWKILNIHPSLLPSFGGKGMYGRKVHRAVLSSGAKVSGPTVHYVEVAVDQGAIIDQQPVYIGDIYKLDLSWEDKVSLLADRVLVHEHRLYSKVIQLQVDGRIKLERREAEREGRLTEISLAVPDYGGSWLSDWEARQTKFVDFQKKVWSEQGKPLERVLPSQP